MKVWLHGTDVEVAEATRWLRQVLDVVTVSDPDHGPSRQVRLEVRLDQPASWDHGEVGG